MVACLAGGFLYNGSCRLQVHFNRRWQDASGEYYVVGGGGFAGDDRGRGGCAGVPEGADRPFDDEERGRGPGGGEEPEGGAGCEQGAGPTGQLDLRAGLRVVLCPQVRAACGEDPFGRDPEGLRLCVPEAGAGPGAQA